MSVSEWRQLFARHRRFILLHSIPIFLPAVLVLGVGGSLFFPLVPRMIRSESVRVTREYRKIAEELLRHPDQANVTTNAAGWRDNGLRIEGRPWGRVEDGAKVIVWVRDAAGPSSRGNAAVRQRQRRANVWQYREVDPIEAIPYGTVYYGWGAAVVLVVLGFTAMMEWHFLLFLKKSDDFLAATAHDLTTPLVGMRRLIGTDDAGAGRLNERMIRLVTNLKDFLRLGGRRPAPKVETFDIVSSCREAYGIFADAYRDLSGGADVAILAPDSLLVRADETLTLQILWNLFGNDLKYAAPHGRVSVRIGETEGRVAVEFADEGPGMTSRQMRRCFDRYYRAGTVLVSGKGGFGIGLCTSKEFAMAMGGDLTVRPNVSRGCVFTLVLPSAEKKDPFVK